MKKSTKKGLLITSAVMLATPAFVQSVDFLKSEEVFAKTVSQDIASWSVGKVAGEEFSIDGVTYHFIARNSDGTVKAIQKDTLNNLRFDTDDSYSPEFKPSSPANIGYYLNNAFYNTLPTYTKNQLVNNSWSIGYDFAYYEPDEMSENDSKVNAYIGLLTRSEYIKALEGTSLIGGKLPYANEDEWTATAALEEGSGSRKIFIVSKSNNNVEGFSSPTKDKASLAVRPAMVFKADTLINIKSLEPIAPEEPVNIENINNTNNTVNLGDIFDDENLADLIFKPNIIVNEPDADIYIQNQNLVIENPKNDGLIKVEVEATNVHGKTAVVTLNMLIEVDNINQGEMKNGKATLKLLQGEFTLKTSDVTSFGTVKLTAAKQTVTTDFAQNFGVVDARGTQEGWNVTVSATPFTVETFDGFVGTPHQLPLGSLALNSVTGIERLNHVNTVDGLPTGLINGLTAIDTNNALNVLNANVGEGLGEFKFNFGPDALALTVDARTAKIDTVNYPTSNTPYASTVTWDLISGPQM